LHSSYSTRLIYPSSEVHSAPRQCSSSLRRQYQADLPSGSRRHISFDGFGILMNPPESRNLPHQKLEAGGPRRLNGRLSNTTDFRANEECRGGILRCRKRRRHRRRNGSSRGICARYERFEALSTGLRLGFNFGSAGPWRRGRRWPNCGPGQGRLLRLGLGLVREWRRPRDGRLIQSLCLGRDLRKRFGPIGARRRQARDVSRLMVGLRRPLIPLSVAPSREEEQHTNRNEPCVHADPIDEHTNSQIRSRWERKKKRKGRIASCVRLAGIK
jgi:hypothetical protein